MRKQRQKEDYWDKYEDYNSESSFNESDCNKPSSDKLSSNEEEEEVIRDNGREKVTHKGLGNDEREVQLEIKERIFESTWRSDTDAYLRGVRGCGLSATKKREKRRKKELENSASYIQSIVDMFSAKYNHNR